ncbi:polysaccharide pyruvyl transferase family protein [Microbacterium sp. NPDC076911]|uniref:polysaccharide pyruvyl transferase family protein n=1 Tax=Microbacterium sp. NPDC076911 TaxID=3154958 RepID=UPI0034165C10
MAVTVVHFNPRIRSQGFRGRLTRGRPLNNFGDLIGPVLVDRILADAGLVQPRRTHRLVAVGSIMKLTRPGDTVWGSGVNGKSMDVGAAPALDVRAVRGPKTRESLEAVGCRVPEVYGDPGLLWSRFWPRDTYLRDGASLEPVGIVPNFHDRSTLTGENVIDPIGDPHAVIGRIARSSFVCGSSLHGIVIAEAFGIPARLIRSRHEPPFKYDDYYAGTGRSEYAVATSVGEAISMGGERPPIFDGEQLLVAFPADLYATQAEAS